MVYEYICEFVGLDIFDKKNTRKTYHLYTKGYTIMSFQENKDTTIVNDL